jgi:DNA-directed RNA polymerase specialized sigma24 family protein
VSGIPSDQVLAILRLRQWAVERNALKCGRTTRLTNAGWRERRETDADARNVRVIDFERALATLDTAHQHALVLTYRDRVGHAATALGCSVRTLAYMLPAARRRLADILDRRDLL